MIPSVGSSKLTQFAAIGLLNIKGMVPMLMPLQQCWKCSSDPEII
jgi:hypothetical protein